MRRRSTQNELYWLAHEVVDGIRPGIWPAIVQAPTGRLIAHAIITPERGVWLQSDGGERYRVGRSIAVGLRERSERAARRPRSMLQRSSRFLIETMLSGPPPPGSTAAPGRNACSPAQLQGCPSNLPWLWRPTPTFAESGSTPAPPSTATSSSHGHGGAEIRHGCCFPPSTP